MKPYLLLVALLAGCASDAKPEANCSTTGGMLLAIDGIPIVISSDQRETFAVLRRDGLLYVVRMDKYGACLLHVGEERGSMPL
jgi:hypothetical protein